ncbi:MAG: extracellular solute-binding protein [Mycobacteriales bacterium]
MASTPDGAGPGQHSARPAAVPTASLTRAALSRRHALRALSGLGLGAAGLTLPACSFTKGQKTITPISVGKKPAPGRDINIEMYSLWGSTTGQGLVDLAAAYEAKQDKVGVRITYGGATSSGGYEQDKLFTAIAGNQPPDIAQLVPVQTSQWENLGIMTDLTDWIEADGIKSSDFLGPAWHDMNVNGRIYQMQWDADPNFPFFYNKVLFEKSGLDPDKPPTTIDEITEYSKKILRKSGGRVTKIGIVPWDQYGMSNSVFTWGWAFGGSFYDDKTGAITPDNEYVVKALEWICNFAKSVGGASNVSISPPGLTLHPISGGNLGMSGLVTTNYTDIVKAKPTNVKLGSALWPYQKPGNDKPGAGAWIGGWAAFIPKGSKHPKEAYDFLKWFSATPEGTNLAYKGAGFPPAYVHSPASKALKADKNLRPYYDVLYSTDHSRPAMPVGSFYATQIDEHAAKALFGQTTPLQAMRTVKENTEKEFARFKKQVKQ